MTTWTYCPSPTGRKTPGRKRPVQLDRELVRVHVRQDVEQVAGVEGDRGAVALDLGLDVALVVADVRGGADRQPISASLPTWSLTMLADELAIRLASRTALSS
jgi:hypothetical protein